jgi:hypothetical protein
MDESFSGNDGSWRVGTGSILEGEALDWA